MNRTSSAVAKALAGPVGKPAYVPHPINPGWGSSGWDFGQGAGLGQTPSKGWLALPPDLRPRTPAQKRLLSPPEKPEGSKGLRNWKVGYTGPRVIKT